MAMNICEVCGRWEGSKERKLASGVPTDLCAIHAREMELFLQGNSSLLTPWLGSRTRAEGMYAILQGSPTHYTLADYLDCVAAYHILSRDMQAEQLNWIAKAREEYKQEPKGE